MGCYLAPDDTLKIESLVVALKERPRDAELLVAGDLNVNLLETEGDWRGEDIAAAMSTEGLEEMSAHFLPRRRSWFRDGRTWGMIREGLEVRSWTDYILGIDRCLFGNVSVQEPRHNSDHYMVLSCLHSVVVALKERPRYAELLVAGDLNVNLLETEGDWRGEDIAAAMSTEGLEEMSAHFLPRRRSWFRDGRTWGMIREGLEVRSWTDYILGIDRCLFGNVSVQEPRHNSDHYMVLSCLHSSPLREHVRYLRGNKQPPPPPPTD